MSYGGASDSIVAGSGGREPDVSSKVIVATEQQQQQAAASMQIAQLLQGLPQALAAALRENRVETNASRTDHRGLGKPYLFESNEQTFLKLLHKMTNFMNSVLKGLGPMLQLAGDSEDATDYREFRGFY